MASKYRTSLLTSYPVATNARYLERHLEREGFYCGQTNDVADRAIRCDAFFEVAIRGVFKQTPPVWFDWTVEIVRRGPAIDEVLVGALPDRAEENFDDLFAAGIRETPEPRPTVKTDVPAFLTRTAPLRMATMARIYGEALKVRFPAGTPVARFIHYLESKGFNCAPHDERGIQIACSLVRTTGFAALHNKKIDYFLVDARETHRWRIIAIEQDGLLHELSAKVSQ